MDYTPKRSDSGGEFPNFPEQIEDNLRYRRVFTKRQEPQAEERALSISVSTFGPSHGPQFVSRDSPVVTGGRWWTTNGLCTPSKGPELLRTAGNSGSTWINIVNRSVHRGDPKMAILETNMINHYILISFCTDCFQTNLFRYPKRTRFVGPSISLFNKIGRGLCPCVCPRILEWAIPIPLDHVLDPIVSLYNLDSLYHVIPRNLQYLIASPTRQEFTYRALVCGISAVQASPGTVGS